MKFPDSRSVQFFKRSCEGSPTSIDNLVVIGGGVLECRNGTYYTKSAVAQYLHELAGYFSRVTFFAAAKSGSAIYQTELDPNRILSLPWTLRPSLRTATAFSKLFRSINGKTGLIFHIPQTSLLPLIVLLHRKVGRLVVYAAGDWVEIGHELRCRGKGWRVPLDNLAATLPLRWANTVLVRGPKLLRQAGAFNQSVVTSLPVIATEHLSVLRADTCQKQHVKLLYVGKLLEGKGLGVLLDAVADLRKSAPEIAARIRLSVFGSGQDEFSLKDRVHRMNLDQVVDFEGFVDDPLKLSQAYDEADIFVMPSQDSEGLPRVVEEAMLHCLPVISTANGGIPLMYRDREDLLLVPIGNTAVMRNAIVEILCNHTLRHRLIANAARSVAQLRSGYTAARQHAYLVKGYSLSLLEPHQEAGT